MSGHSKWSTIKRQKAATDLKRGQVFSKYSKLITLAAKEGGDPATNFKLRLLTEKAKAAGMPGENIERAIRRGTGEEKGGELKQVSYEGLGPAGSTFVIEAASDNTNRTLGELKQIFQKNNGRLADSGSVIWNYQQRGLILADHAGENTELVAIEAGAEDINKRDEGFEIYTSPKDLAKIKEALEKTGSNIVEATLAWMPKQTIDPTEQERVKINALSDALESNDDITAVYDNLS